MYRSTPEQTDLLEIPTDFDAEDIQAVLALQNELDCHLGTMCWKYGTTLGEAAQVDLLGYLDRVESILREAFELNEVEESVRKRTRDLFETKGERAKRAKLMKKSNSLSEVE